MHYSPDPTGASKLIDEIPVDPAGAGEFLSDLRSTPELSYGNRLSAPLVSHFPCASRDGEKMLDLGCGDRNFEKICRQVTGFDYLGVDYDGDKPDMLADAHALPFSDSAFAFVLSVAVLEHLAFPDIAVSEAFRVLQPGGMFIGTVAFLEPFHMNSHYHMTHLGLQAVLSRAGFDVVAIAPNHDWSGSRAQAEMALYPGMPTRLQQAVAAAPNWISRMCWAAKRQLKGTTEASDLLRVARNAGGFRFVARRPATAVN
ncbi:hypothetical protein GCM10007036_36950 [Alsobacter metallidurans]|uniref:Methyltransferase type 11 domain-containing protein n=1 Tax=Alsobacter metallidurans TaxID=340221 RepID=A0A917MJ21_9HYPH|nr:hypothetical protein GCM10007036_36950 [Alsobacter metallidurans]